MSGYHGPDDGPPGRSAGVVIGRAVPLLVVAVALGVILLYSSGAPGSSSTSPSSVVTPTGSTGSGPTSTSTTAPPGAITPGSVPPSKTKTVVANGTSVNGAAGRVGNTLRTGGYDVLATTNASSKASSSQVYYVAGYAEEAGLVASRLGLSPHSVLSLPSPPPVRDTRGADVVVVIGPDLASGSASSRTTSTT